MSKFVSAEDKVFARKVDLFGFLLKNYPDAVKVEQNSLRLKANRSITIKRGYCGYTDWATSETGNSIDMLMRYFGYSFVDAVAALCEFAGRFSYPQSRLHSLPQPDRTKAVEASAPKDDTFVLPKRDPGRYSRLFAYLNKTRKLPQQIIGRLVDEGLLYQEEQTGNAVFINADQSFFEIRGTNSQVKFHKTGHRADRESDYWSFNAKGPGTIPTVAYICEGAIDAISLYLLRQSSAPESENGMYCSLCGVANQKRIERIKSDMSAIGAETVIAVDSDMAGKRCRISNPDCQALIPVGKDWNEDLKQMAADGGF